MPPKGEKTFTQNTVTVLVAQMLRSGGGRSALDYKLMSALDGTRTVSSFEHEFREIVKDAKALNAKHGDGDALPATPTARSRAAPKSTPTKAAAGTKRGAAAAAAAAASPSSAVADGDSPTSAKKARVVKKKADQVKEEAKEDEGVAFKDVGDEFINWEGEF